MSVFARLPLSVGNLLLNVSNYRIVTQDSQKSARDAIIAEQGKKLSVLAKDIAENGLSPFDLPMVIDAEDGNQNYIVMEGNRRLTAIQLMLDPELAKGTPIHAAFSKLHKQHSDAIPKVIDCAVAPSRKVAIEWGKRKHASGLGGAGTEPWTPMSKARADKDEGNSTPALDVIDFVMTNKTLDSKVRHVLEGSQFNLSTLERLITTKELQEKTGVLIADGKVKAEKTPGWTQKVLTDVVTIIATSKKDGKKWTEREVDTPDRREDFAESIVKAHPGAKPAAKKWIVSGTPKPAPESPKAAKKKSTPSTDEQPNLVPKGFKLELPAGKINDVFVELKNLNATTHRHAVSVLFRVFFEFTLDEFINKRKIQLPKDKQGHTIDKYSVRLDHVIKNVKSTKLMSEKDLTPVNVAIGNQNSVFAPASLNSFVHSNCMNPDPLQLKLAWANVQLFIERLWTAK